MAQHQKNTGVFMNINSNHAHHLALNNLAKSLCIGLATLSLMACGSPEDRERATTENPHQHQHKPVGGMGEIAKLNIISQGRLLVSDHDSNKAYVYGLQENKVLQTLELSGSADGLQTSPQGKYALVLDRHNGVVTFFDSGLSLIDHGDHHHAFVNPVQKMPLVLNYATPNHYQIHGQQAGLFFDGEGKKGDSGNTSISPARFAVITDQDIKRRSIMTQVLNTNMHGTAEVRGEYVISTNRLSTTGSTLADTLVLFHQHGDHFHQEKTFTQKCPSLHGSGSVKDYSVFACADGVVSIKQEGNQFTEQKIPNPDSIANSMCKRPNRPASPSRIGSFATHPSHQFLVGTACGQPYIVNPNENSMTKITWTTDSSRKVLSYDFDTTGNYLLLLDDAGKVFILDVQQNFKVIKVLDVIPEGVADGGHGGQKFINNPNTHLTYLIHPSQKQIAVIDLKTKSLNQPIQLDFTPSNLTWFGAVVSQDRIDAFKKNGDEEFVHH